MQDFYLSGEKFSDPFLTTVANAGKYATYLCVEDVEGKYIQWHKNGQKGAEGIFKNDNMVGIWRAWDEKGNLIIEKDFGTPTD